MCENCSEKERLIEMHTDIKWIKKSLEDTKGVGVYKKMTWVNFAGLMAVAISIIKGHLT